MNWNETLKSLLGSIVGVLSTTPWLSVQGRLRFQDGKYMIFVAETTGAHASAIFAHEEVDTIERYGDDKLVRAFIRFDSGTKCCTG